MLDNLSLIKFRKKRDGVGWVGICFLTSSTMQKKIKNKNACPLHLVLGSKSMLKKTSKCYESDKKEIAQDKNTSTRLSWSLVNSSVPAFWQTSQPESQAWRWFDETRMTLKQDRDILLPPPSTGPCGHLTCIHLFLQLIIYALFTTI